MTRGMLLAYGLLAAGCSKEPPPIREAREIKGEQTVVAPFDPPKKPEKSDPAAAKLIADALNAHTGGDRSKLDKLKAVSIHRVGVGVNPQGGRLTLDWRVDLRYPDTFRVESTLSPPGQPSIVETVVYTPTASTRSIPGYEKLKATASEMDDRRAQLKEDEAVLLYPLADAATVAVPAADETVNGRPAAGAYVWCPALDGGLIHFDKATGLMVRLVYRGRETGEPLLKELVFRKHDDFGGVKLPSKYLLRANGRDLLDFESQTYEVGKTFDPARFVP